MDHGGLLILLFLLDQHRLQPWAYQTALYSMVFASMNASAARRWLLPLAASVYIYSALGKFDYQFVHTVGIDFLKAIARPIGGLPAHVSISRLAMIAYLFPATELLLGVLLLPKFSRRVAGVAAMIMHASLIGILGPWSLNHSAGVLVWNLLLMIQSWFLFVRPANRSDREHPAIEFSRGATFGARCRHVGNHLAAAGKTRFLGPLALMGALFTTQQPFRCRDSSFRHRASAGRCVAICGARFQRGRMARTCTGSLVLGNPESTDLSASPLSTGACRQAG